MRGPLNRGHLKIPMRNEESQEVSRRSPGGKPGENQQTNNNINENQKYMNNNKIVSKKENYKTNEHRLDQ